MLSLRQGEYYENASLSIDSVDMKTYLFSQRLEHAFIPFHSAFYQLIYIFFKS